MTWMRARLSYANVVATLALFVALGGSAAAAAFIVSSNSQIGPATIYGANAPAGKNKNVVGKSIGAGDLGSGAVINDRLAPDAVTQGKIAAGAVVAGKLGNAAVAQANLAGGAVTVPKLGADVLERIDAQKGGATHFAGTAPLYDLTTVKTVGGVDFNMYCDPPQVIVDAYPTSAESLDASGTRSDGTTVSPLSADGGSGVRTYGPRVDLNAVMRNRSVGRYNHIDFHATTNASGCPYWGVVLPVA
jgi:hypothetical protein